MSLWATRTKSLSDLTLRKALDHLQVVCTHTHAHTPTHTLTHTHPHTHTHTHPHTHTPTHTHPHKHIGVCSNKYTLCYITCALLYRYTHCILNLCALSLTAHVLGSSSLWEMKGSFSFKVSHASNLHIGKDVNVSLQ